MINAYFKEIAEMLKENDIANSIKRIIDLTLDTHNITHYKKCIELIEQIESTNLTEEKKLDSIRQFHDRLAKELELRRPTISKEPILTINDITKTYTKGRFRLGPISLTLHAGDLIGLVGENGNGKTSLLRILTSDLMYDGGKIDYNFKYSNQYDLRTKLVYIEQRTPVWKGGILENLEYTLAMYGIYGEENQLLTQLYIARFGLRKYRNYKWAELSSGYKMRFELVRAFLRSPKILLIDEPLSNLDIVSQQEILIDLKHCAMSPFRPLGIILSSQQLYEVEKNANNIIFLKEGSPRYLNEENKDENNNCIIEFETSLSLQDLKEKLQNFEYKKIEISANSFLIYLKDGDQMKHFLDVSIKQDIPIIYFRDVSNSSRRFFVKN